MVSGWPWSPWEPSHWVRVVGNDHFCATTKRASQRLTPAGPRGRLQLVSQKWVDKFRGIPQPCTGLSTTPLDQTKLPGTPAVWATAMQHLRHHQHRNRLAREFFMGQLSRRNLASESVFCFLSVCVSFSFLLEQQHQHQHVLYGGARFLLERPRVPSLWALAKAPPPWCRCSGRCRPPTSPPGIASAERRSMPPTPARCWGGPF